MNKQKGKRNFIIDIIDRDIAEGENGLRIHTRFPPEPNGYLHIGHAKSICLNFGIASDYNGLCNLRFDDTNPSKEEDEYVQSIKKDVSWLGFDWQDRLYYASDYFDKFYEFATCLIKKNKAYVCDLNSEEMRQYRGDLNQAGRNSPYRDRSVEENLDLFQRMKNGEFKDGVKVLRAKIDMASPNLNMRDPVIYRILHVSHHRAKDKWCIYPMYDFAHGFEDSIEKITHSICTLEFENHRPLYDWFLDQSEVFHPKQIEFARLNLSYTIMSKRKLLQLVQQGHVSGWDDPRMPTISGLRRRGYTPQSIRNFCDIIGVAKFNSMIELTVLENSIRAELNKTASRVMAVLNPLKVVITNYPEDKVEEIEAINNPEDQSVGTRKVPFSRELYIERDDFQEVPHKKFFRLALGREVRLRYSYFITCNQIIKDNDGNIVELHCTYDPQTYGGNAPDGRKVKATMHWVCAKSAYKAEVRLYDHLFKVANPDIAEDGLDFTSNLNQESLTILKVCQLEPSLKKAMPGMSYQFERLGYFNADLVDSIQDAPVFNRIVSLRDTWAKIKKS